MPAEPADGLSATGAAGLALPAPLLMVVASLLFALMGAVVKWVSMVHSASEIVMFRGLTGMTLLAVLARLQGTRLRTAVPAMHLWRSVIGVTALGLWFFAIGGLPLGTAVTLNYMSSVWMALFMVGGAWMTGAMRQGLDGRLVATVFAGFAGVALVLQPSLDSHHLWYGLAGLLSGIFAALAYFQVVALGRQGEPELRVVFYFSLGSALGGAATAALLGGFRAPSLAHFGLLVSIGVLATVAQLCMTRAYAVGHTLTNAALQYLGVGFSFVLGVWLFDDRVTWTAVLGMALIVGAGLAATVLRSRQGSASDTPAES